MEAYLASSMRLAYDYGWREKDLNTASRVVSFVRENERINVYYTTGTVGTCVNHPSRGKTQLFRRNVTLQQLGDIFMNPRAHTGKGYYTNQGGSKRGREEEDHDVAARPPRDELSELRAALAVVDAEREELLAIIRAEEERIAQKKREEEAKAELERLRQDRIRKEEEEQKEGARKAAADREAAAQAEQKRSNRGTCATWILTDSDHMEKCSPKDANCIALSERTRNSNDSCFILSYDGGRCAFSSGLPKGLHNKLNGRQRHLPGIEYVVLGPDGQYYVRFSDGSFQHALISPVLGEWLNAGHKLLMLAFGHEGSYYAHFEGQMPFMEGVAKRLRDLVVSRWKQGPRFGPPTFVSLDQADPGNFFVAWNHGREVDGLLPASAGQESKNLRFNGYRVTQIHLGAAGEYLIRYE